MEVVNSQPLASGENQGALKVIKKWISETNFEKKILISIIKDIELREKWALTGWSINFNNFFITSIQKSNQRPSKIDYELNRKFSFTDSKKDINILKQNFNTLIKNKSLSLAQVRQILIFSIKDFWKRKFKNDQFNKEIVEFKLSLGKFV